MNPENLNQDLSATHYCDFDHPAMRERAALLAENSGSPYQTARNTFLWVRDQIPFGLDLIKVKTSDTLQKGYGACYGKSLLMVGLLRANHIPARFCSAPVSRWFMKPYMGMWAALVNDPFHHCMAKLNLDGEWTLAEPALDQKAYSALFRPVGVEWGIEWDADTQDRLYLEHLRGDPVEHPDIDQAIGRNVGNTLMPDPIALAFCRRINRKAWAKAGVSLG